MLGKLPAKYDERTLRLENYLPETALLPPLPPQFSWNKKISKWTMMANDKYGDCVVAGAGHTVQRWTSNAGHEVILPDKTIVDTYLKLTGGVDSGLYLLDFLRYWRKNGLGTTAPIGAFVAVSPKNITLMRYACYLFGSVYIGAALPLSAKTQIDHGLAWDVPPGGPIDDGEPGSWGGHCMASGYYAQWGYSLDTWGQQQQCTKNWMGQYCDEAYAILSLDWFNEGHRTPLGMDWRTLLKDLTAVTK